MVAATTTTASEQPQPVFSGEEIIELQNLVRQVPVATEVIEYAVRLTIATRPTIENPSAIAVNKIKWGAGSRASQALILAGKARALLEGRFTVAIEDIQRLAVPVLRHRIIPSFHAEAEGVTADAIIQEIIATLK